MPNKNTTPPAELTHRIIKSLFDAYNELGFGYQEKHYYRIAKLKFLGQGLEVKDQLLVNIIIGDKVIGRYFLDFLINGEVVVEIKVANAVYPAHIKQVPYYLRANGLKLGLVAVFSKNGVLIKRVIN